MKTITVIGGGWLGRPLAHYLETIGHQTYVSKTTNEGVQQLKQESLNAFEFDLNAPLEDLIALLSKQSPDIVIGCFPPGFRSGGGVQYVEHWKKLVEACLAAEVTKLVMVSSTTVYPDTADAMLEDQASLSLSQSHDQFGDKAKIMLQAEQYVKDSGLKFGVVRCSGLVGPERHPSRFAPRLKQVSDLAPANMLHLTDAVGAVSFVANLEQNCVVNATTPNTVSKAEFYQAALDSVGSNEPLPPIVHIADKRIVADALINLGYRFHHLHTLELV
ncbi:NAD-dependent epimerase/dehydratase family protein [Vibrio aquaticus]|uniref:NAD-dependent epimerase/dehydratase family protein n=1 Tax=Vibrio aquaticus TaxID=2496559 RepID=A0A3S0MND8_9VIBR|nr:NAD-dependent epimerase/dehydratase family protein [Vibrio aquaticus]RTZ15723.1 NAD-dependent epimerase/dehydratase family protein [Vibrio aquaticus]